MSTYPSAPLIYTCSNAPRPNSVAIRSPSDNIAADIAATRSSSTLFGSAVAIASPSELTTAEASISGDEACRSRNRSMMSCERVFINAYSGSTRQMRYETYVQKLNPWRIIESYSCQPAFTDVQLQYQNELQIITRSDFE
jgi:hypothetical protein